LRQKSLKVCYKVLLSKNFQRQSYNATNYLSNGINILAGDDSIPVKFRPKSIHPHSKDARFTFHTRSAVESALAYLFIIVSVCDVLMHVAQNLQVLRVRQRAISIYIYLRYLLLLMTT